MTGGSKGRVLVVDDDPAIRMLCRVNLELDGYTVEEAGTLAAAREALAAAPPDVVLLDLHLGSVSSHALIAECAALTPRVPVVLVTGSADVGTARETGADAVLTKPFEIEALRSTVDLFAAAR